MESFPHTPADGLPHIDLDATPSPVRARVAQLSFRIGITFIIFCLALLFTAAAITFAHSPNADDDEDSSSVLTMSTWHS